MPNPVIVQKATVTADSGGGVSTLQATFANPTQTGNTIVIVVGAELAGGSINTPGDTAGNTYTAGPTPTVDGPIGCGAWSAKISLGTSGHTVFAVLNGSGSSRAGGGLIAYEITNLRAGNPIDQVAIAGAGAGTSGNITPTDLNALCIGLTACRESGGTSPPIVFTDGFSGLSGNVTTNAGYKNTNNSTVLGTAGETVIRPGGGPISYSPNITGGTGGANVTNRITGILSLRPSAGWTAADALTFTDHASPAVRLHASGTDSIALVDVAGSPGVIAPARAHSYELVTCDMWGCAYGQIASAVVTDVTWVLHDIGSLTFTFDVFDPTAAAALPMDCIPGGREVQLWRDGVLIWWGVPVTATPSATQISVQCSGLLWWIDQVLWGPTILNAIVDGSFEYSGGVLGALIANWTTSVGAAFNFQNVATGGITSVGQYAIELINSSPTIQNTFIAQGTLVTAPGNYTVAADVWIDPASVPAGGLANCFDPTELWVEVTDASSNVIFQGSTQVKATDVLGEWLPISIAIGDLTPTGPGYTIAVQLHCPSGKMIWDNVRAEALPLPFTGTIDQIIEHIVAYAQDPTQGKSNLALPVVINGTPPVTPFTRDFGSQWNSSTLQSLSEWPTSGYCDYEITWDTTGHFRYFTVWFPSKGSVQYNFPVTFDAQTITQLSGTIDGSQAATTERVLGQGSGAAQDVGYAAFGGFIAAPGGTGFPGGNSPRVITDGVLTATTSTLDSATAHFTSADLGLPVSDLSGFIPAGSTIGTIVSTTRILVKTPGPPTMFFSGQGSNLIVSIGAITIEKSVAAQNNQPVQALQSLAEGLLLRESQAPVLLQPRVVADGPTGLMGNVVVGDVVPVSFNYGWVQAGGPSGTPMLQRITQLTLYPVTEEIAPVLNTIAELT